MKKASLGLDGRQAQDLGGHSSRVKTREEMPEKGNGGHWHTMSHPTHGQQAGWWVTEKRQKSHWQF